MRASNMMKSDLLHFTLTATCAIALLSFAVTQFLYYQKYPVATRASTRVVDERLAFPAITLCDHFYRYTDAESDFGFPVLPFVKKKDLIIADPSRVYARLAMFDRTVEEFLWGYYFTADMIMERCSVGGISCVYPKDAIRAKYTNGSWPPAAGDWVEIEVPAGKWISRILADSQFGHNHMCHTLVANVTSNFSLPGGNSLSVTFSLEYMRRFKHLAVHVHDRHEEVLLPVYAIADPTSISLPRPPQYVEVFSDDFNLMTKKKVKMFPKMYHNANVKFHQCNASEDYSKNLCDLRTAWRKRLATVRATVGADKFRCVLPGIIVTAEDKLPVCQHPYYATMEGGDPMLGLLDLMQGSDIAQVLNISKNPYGRDMITMLTQPVIGSELVGSMSFKGEMECLERCSYYQYKLSEDQVDPFQEEMYNVDLLLYFGSLTKEVWEEYPAYEFLTFLSDIGGMMGLLLGASLLSLMESAIALVAKFAANCNKSPRA